MKVLALQSVSKLRALYPQALQLPPALSAATRPRGTARGGHRWWLRDGRRAECRRLGQSVSSTTLFLEQPSEIPAERTWAPLRGGGQTSPLVDSARVPGCWSCEHPRAGVWHQVTVLPTADARARLGGHQGPGAVAARHGSRPRVWRTGRDGAGALPTRWP